MIRLLCGAAGAFVTVELVGEVVVEVAVVEEVVVVVDIVNS